MKRTILIAAFLVGCGDDSMMANADAPPSADAAIDAPPSIDAPSSNADAGPLCGASDGGAVGTHKLFLNFEAVTITSGSNCNDATTNCSFIATANTDVPQFASANANRAQLIADILTDVNGVLAPYSIEVTTTRPAAGPYKMVVFAQCVTSLGCAAGTGSIGPVECMNFGRNDIAFVFEDTSGNANHIFYANEVLFLLGLANGVSITEVPNDCLCHNCGSTTQVCNYGTDVPVVNGTCLMSPAHENEQSMLSGALGCRF